MKTDNRITTLQQKREDQHEESFLGPLQPIEAPKREGRKNDICPDKYLFNDFLNPESIDENQRLERRHHTDFSHPVEGCQDQTFSVTQNS